MIVFYPQIKWLHILCVILSGSLFTLRGTLMLSGSTFANHLAVRWLSYAIDITLLTAALMLVTILHQYPFVQSWLTVKILLLLVYIWLGMRALHHDLDRTKRIGYFSLALTVYLFMATIAYTHNPLGLLSLVPG